VSRQRPRRPEGSNVGLPPPEVEGPTFDALRAANLPGEGVPTPSPSLSLADAVSATVLGAYGWPAGATSPSIVRLIDCAKSSAPLRAERSAKPTMSRPMRFAGSSTL
jgi:hypothetical protein